MMKIKLMHLNKVEILENLCNHFQSVMFMVNVCLFHSNFIVESNGMSVK